MESFSIVVNYFKKCFSSAWPIVTTVPGCKKMGAAAFNVFCLRLEVFNQVTDSFSVPLCQQLQTFWVDG